MALYYYDRYYATEINPRWQLGSNWGVGNYFSDLLASCRNGYTNYAYDSATGVFSDTGSYVALTTSSPLYNADNHNLNRYTEISRDATHIHGVTEILGAYYTNDGYSQGDYINTIIAENGTYPNNDYQGGYWYVKGDIAWTPPNLKPNIGGVLKAYSAGWVNVGGNARQIDAMWVNVGGVLKKM